MALTGNHVPNTGDHVGDHNLIDQKLTSLTKTDVGLSNVDNTSDVNKPVSTAQQTALNLKAPLNSPAFTGTPTGVTKTHVGLGNVDNTSDATKQATFDLRYVRTVNGSTPDGAGNVAVSGGGGGGVPLNPVVTVVTASGATRSITVTDEAWYDVTLDQNCTFTLVGGTAGQKFRINMIVRQNATGGWLLTWPSSVTWLVGSPNVPLPAGSSVLFELFTDDGGATWFGVASGSSAKKDKKRRTAGSITVNVAAWNALDAGGTLDLTTAAKAGDELMIGINGMWGNQAVNGRLDAATMVGGNPVQWASAQGGGVQSSFGVAAWAGLTGVYGLLAAPVLLTLTAADISNGFVTVRFFGKVDSAVTKTLLAQALPGGTPLDLWMVNLG